jgi:hypothetical protein
LTYVSDDPNAYKLLGAEGERTYELVTNEALDDYTALAHFIDVLNNTATEEFEAEFSAVFDVQTFLRQLAAEVAFGHWDGVWFFQNNFALYHLPETGLMYFIPFDVDNIMGINFFPHLIDVGTVDPLEFGIRNEPGLPEAHPLPDNVLAVGAWRDEFLQSFRDLMNGPVSLDVVAPRIDFLRDQIATSVQADPLYPLGAGYSYQTFLDSFDVATGGLATYGLREFLWWRAQEGFPAGLELR